MSEDVTHLCQMFEASEETTRDARKLSERDRDYYDNKQWTAEETAALAARKQPVVTYNRIARKIDFLSGLEKQQRKDPKAFPRTPKDQDAADAATDAIRYVCEDTDWDAKRSNAWDDLLIEGTCAVMVGHKEAKGGNDPEIVHIPWDRLFFDPKSSRADFSDARYMGIVTWYDFDVAEAKGWPLDVIEATMANDKDTGTFDDKPKEKMWADAKRKRFRAIEIYHKAKGKWTRCVFTQGGYLEKSTPSPYMDEDGKPENPIKAMSLYVDRENNRYGAVRVLISPQDEINKRRSKGLHLITMRQARVGRSSETDAETIRKELAKPDGIIVSEGDDFEILENNDMAAANFNLLQEAKNEIDLLGANAALAGKNENDMSGRAILAQQQGGMVEVARMFDRLRSLSIAVYRSAWNRVRQLWTDEKWIRITDDENNLRFVGLNQQVTIKMLAEEVARGDPAAMQKAAQIVGPELLQAYMQGDPQAQMILGQFVQQNGDKVVETRNAVNELDVDIVIDEGMDTPSVQAEQFDTIVKTIPAFGALMESQAPMAKALLKVVVQSSQLRDKDKLLEILEPEPGQEQGPTPEQMMQMQADAERQQAEAAAAVETDKAKIKAGSDIEVAKIKAETERMIAEEKLKSDAHIQVRREVMAHEAKMQVETETGEGARKASEKASSEKMQEGQMALMAQLATILAEMNRPKTKIPVRDENGFIVGIREVNEAA